MAPSTKSPKRRYLTLLEVADLADIDAALPRRVRRQRVWRLFRGFELRDDTKYLHQTGGPTSPMKICVEDLHLLDPWDPSTVQAIRNDVDGLADQHSRLNRRVKSLEDFAERASAFLKKLAQTDSRVTQKPVH